MNEWPRRQSVRANDSGERRLTLCLEGQWT
jgi:hypothetical protein